MPNDLTLLEIVDTACNELGLTAPSTVVGNANLQVKQLLALLNRDGSDLYRSRDWTCLQGEHIINVETPITTTGTWSQGGTTITGIPSAADRPAPDGVPAVAAPDRDDGAGGARV
jgi:hypothetical protein